MEFLAAGNETAADKFFLQGFSVTSCMQRQFMDVSFNALGRRGLSVRGDTVL